MYADDTALSYAPNLTTDLERYLKEYFVINKLSFNIQTCEFLTVGTPQCLTRFKDVNIKIENINIVKVSISKYFGFVIDQTLRREHHINFMGENK